MGIRISRDQRVISLDALDSSYIFHVTQEGEVVHVYWGKRLSNLEDLDLPVYKNYSTFERREEILPEEMTAWGQLRYKEPSLKIHFQDGTRDLCLIFDGFSLENEKLQLHFSDLFYKVHIHVNYEVYSEHGMIKRKLVIENKEDQDIELALFYSGEWNFPHDQLYLTNVEGTWANEGNLFRRKLAGGKTIFESRKGITGHNYNPCFMVDQEASEFSGDVFFGCLAYSGNFKLVAEQRPFGDTRVLLGINDFDSLLSLQTGKSFETPEVFFGHTAHGFNAASHALHTFSLDRLLPDNQRREVRPVLYNSWEAVKFNVDLKSQEDLAEKAASLGTELFVVDDGWFKNRNHSRSGLGDWYPDEIKFPDGLAPLIQKVNELGMKFGLWIEPEMVSKDSHLYRMHPDWVYGFENREATMSRSQLVLNLTKPEVFNYLFFIMDTLLERYKISFIKWDMNRPFSEPGALNLPADRRQEIWVEHNRTVFRLLSRLREKHPSVMWEGCASGGGRVNFEAIQYFDQLWPSDNTDALDRIGIQHAFSFAYPAKVMASWVTDSPNGHTKRKLPLSFRCDVSMTGVMGIGCNLSKLKEDDLKLLRDKISYYKKIRDVIQHGDLLRISASNDIGQIHSVQYIKKEKSVVFVFKKGKSTDTRHRVKLAGLAAEKRYCISYGEKIIAIKSGDYLMNAGLQLYLPGGYTSRIFEVYPKAGELYKKQNKRNSIF
ncbi:alpha-galactosidase [Peribacillus kribbensis]|uniref:alpha-galactosidase n=1 Tax=Peribacillus kribbensis TaxID=356658 RepID=UPI000418ECD8|nr:alpha-galactosidase [Peribacillus kribbensis]